VVKVPPGTTQVMTFELPKNPSGKLTFAFFPGSDPHQPFQGWIEHEPFGKRAARKKVSKPVTFT
jgi:hypothetical protein